MAVHDPPDPNILCPDQRLDELADILARGVIRALSTRTATPVSNSPGSSPNGLDDSPETRLHVPAQLTQVESAEGATT